MVPVRFFPLLLCGGLFVASLLPPTAAHAQQRYLEPFSVENGLPASQVWDGLQDERGYLWFALFMDGVARFDGHTFETFSARDGLPHSTVVTLHEDSTGTLWFGTRGGLASYDGRSFDAYTQADGLHEDDVRSIAGGPDGRIWIGTPGGVFSYDGTEFSALAPDRLSEINPSRVAERKDTLWIGTNEGLYWYDGTTLTDVGQARGSPDRDIVSLTVGGDETLWVGTEQGAFRYDGAQFDILEGTQALEVNAVRHSHGERVWVGTDEGLFRHVDGSVKPVTSQLSGVSVRTLFRDREQNVWVGTNLEGLYKHPQNPFDHFTSEEGLMNEVVWNVVEGPGGDLWIATQNGVSRYDGKSFYQVWDEEETGGTPYLLRRIDDSLLIGSQGGLFVYDGDTLTPEVIEGRRPGTIFEIAEGPSGVYWLATNDGLVRYDGTSYRLYTTENGLSHNAIRSLDVDGQNRVWIGFEKGGVDRFDGASFTSLNVASQISGQANVSDIRVDSAGGAWLGTKTGIYRRPPPSAHTDSLRRFSVQDGLLDNQVYCLLLSETGHLWAGTSEGANRLDVRAYEETGEMTIRTYGKQEGFLGVETNSNAIYQDSRGQIWFGTVGGLTRYDPSADRRNEVEPQPRVTAVRLFDENPDLDAYADGRTSWEHLPTGLQLPYHKDHLTFRFVGLSFRRPDRVRYQFKLEGVDEQWAPVTERRQATYANIDPGTYTFKVKAANGDGVWSSPAATYSFTIHPPFWRTTWFYLLCGGLFLGGLIAAVRWRTWQLRRRQERLAATVEERTREIEAQKEQLAEQAERLEELDEAKTRFFANVSHEFRTPLTLILGPVRDLRDRLRQHVSKEDAEQLNVVERNARRLLRLVDQILGIARMEAGTYQLSARPTDVGAEVRRIAHTFEPMAERADLQLAVEGPEDGQLEEPPPVYVDREALEHILSNLLSNAIKFTPAGGTITVSAVEHDEAVEVMIVDTGPGIPADKQDAVFDRFQQVDDARTRSAEGAGIGLAFVKDLVDLHGGTIDLESTVGEGTTVTVRLQRGAHHLAEEQIDDAVRDGRPQAGDEAVEPRTDGGPPDSAPTDVLSGDGVPAAPVPSEAEEAPREADSDEAPEQKRVLVVDDNAEVRRYMRSILEPSFAVLEATDGEEGLETAREALPDVILADVMMPFVDGREMTRRLRADPDTDAIPVIMVTARAGTEEEVEGLQVGADDYVTKPFDAEVLQQRVEGVVALQERLRDRLQEERRDEAVERADDAQNREQEQSELEREARRVIREHLTDSGFDTTALAEQMAMSRSALYRAFDEETDTTPSALITEVRMERATELLRDGEGTVTQVAYAVGYNTLSSFSRAFREYVGQSPSTVARSN